MELWVQTPIQNDSERLININTIKYLNQLPQKTESSHQNKQSMKLVQAIS
jgi:hypothetical protein